MLKTVSSITKAIGALNYNGTWNASNNTPALASGVGTKGDYYVVSVAGTPSDAIVLVPGAVEILRFNKGTFFSGLASGATTVYVTPGEGL